MITYNFNGPSFTSGFTDTIAPGASAMNGANSVNVGGGNLLNINFTLTNAGAASTSVQGVFAQANFLNSFFFTTQNNTANQPIDFTLTLSFSTTPAQTGFTATPTINFTTGGAIPGGVATAVNGNQITFSGTTSGNGAQFSINSITADFVCFTAGTAIATPDGDRAVESLAPGDRVLTANGAIATVAWLGQMPVDTRLTHPARANPVRISAHALGPGLPARDLDLSPDHAIALDGLLINARALVNGTTIRQRRTMPKDGFTYYHVELEEGHQLLLAEGVAAESYVDYASRDTFANATEAPARPITELDMPRISSARLLPESIRAALSPAPAMVAAE